MAEQASARRFCPPPADAAHYQALLGELATASGEFVALAAGSDMARPVPRCGPWLVRDLIEHLGQLWDWVTRQLDSPDRPAIDDRPSGPAERAEAVRWLEGYRRGLLDALGARSGNERTWSWSSDATCGFWLCRIGVETCVHLHDLVTALGVEADAIGARTAVAGVREFWLHQIPDEARGLTGRGEVVAVEVAGQRLAVRLTPNGPEALDAAPLDPDCLVTYHDPAALLLMLWRRAPLAEETVRGDVGLWSSLHDAMEL